MQHTTQQPDMNREQFARALARTRPLMAAEKKALFRWFRNLTMSNALRMALRHGGRYLVIDGGRHGA